MGDYSIPSNAKELLMSHMLRNYAHINASQSVIGLDSTEAKKPPNQKKTERGESKTNILLLQPMEDLHSNHLNHASLHSRYLSSSDIVKHYPTKVIFPASSSCNKWIGMARTTNVK